MTLRIVSEKKSLPPVTIKFRDDGYYWGGNAQWAEEIFEAFYTKDPNNKILNVLDCIRNQFHVEPRIEIVSQDDENDLVSIETPWEDLEFLWNEIRIAELNKKNIKRENTQIEMINRSMGFYSNWEHNLITAIDDTLDMIEDNDVFIDDETCDFYFNKATQEMNAELIENFYLFIQRALRDRESCLPFCFHGLNINAQNYIERQEARNIESIKSEMKAVVNYREEDWRPVPARPTLKVLRPE